MVKQISVVKNIKNNKIDKKYLTILKKNDKISFYTLQKQEETKKFSLTLKNTENNNEITLYPITENTKHNKKISKINRLDENTNLCRYLKSL